jgi:hypothetical protein
MGQTLGPQVASKPDVYSLCVKYQLHAAEECLLKAQLHMKLDQASARTLQKNDSKNRRSDG